MAIGMAMTTPMAMVQPTEKRKGRKTLNKVYLWKKETNECEYEVGQKNQSQESMQ